MKSVLISINPKWCELIASGKKTVEVRKTRPKIETPFKVYIYMTAGDAVYPVTINGAPYICSNVGGRGVIGEFVCRNIDSHGINELIVREDAEHALMGTCLTKGDVLYYLCYERGTSIYEKPYVFYGWHISDLVIYDKPRELVEFFNPNKILKSQCMTCVFNDGHGHFKGCKGDNCWENTRLKRPPQSWCYVEAQE